MEKTKKPTVDSLVFTLGFVIGCMIGLFCIMAYMVYIAIT